jgi:thiamine-phosphate pyrophosphorylase
MAMTRPAAPKDPPRTSRLCLVTPRGISIDLAARKLEAALAGGDVASLIVTGEAADPDALQALAARLAPIAQARGTAVLVQNDTRIAGRVKADGVHIDSGPADLAEAIRTFHPQRIAGVGNIRSRHEALEAGELGPDYVFFGRLDGDSGPGVYPKALDLAAWWSEMVEIPAIVMGGAAPSSVIAVRDAGIEFVALSRAVFDAENPRDAVAEASLLLAGAPEIAR